MFELLFGLLRRGRKVAMVASVNEPPLVAGKTYRLKTAQADALVLKGYAKGDLSRVYTGDEANALRSNSQTVSL